MENNKIKCTGKIHNN